MKGKRYSTEDKIRILRQADAGQSIVEVCKEHNLSQVSFHRWKKQFGQMEVNETKRLKELERENTELKKKQFGQPARDPSPQIRMRKKALRPACRRVYALKAVEGGLGSGRKVCQILTVPRSSYWYRPKEKTSWEEGILKRVIELSDKHPRYGYRRIAALLLQGGWHVGKRRIQSLRRSLGLRVPPTKRKVIRRGYSTGLPVKAEHKGHVWTWDFICDGTTRGGSLRMLTILDEYTREGHVL